MAQLIKYKKSSLQVSAALNIYNILLQIMISRKPYNDPDVALIQIADMLSISRHHLSQILNEYAKQNFYDFINKYRIEEIKQNFQNPVLDHMTILDIVFNAGFNSKSAFNAAFKKYTNLTPSQYRKSVKTDLKG